jgi:hypothetical protein
MVSLGLDERVLAVVAEGVRHLLVSFFLFGETLDNGIGEAVCNFGLCRVACPAGYVSRSASTGGFYTRRGAGVARSTAVGSVGLGVEADDRVARGERGEALRAAVRAGRAGRCSYRCETGFAPGGPDGTQCVASETQCGTQTCAAVENGGARELQMKTDLRGEWIACVSRHD